MTAPAPDTPAPRRAASSDAPPESGCVWCGLPLTGRAKRRQQAQYCCYGCCLAHAIAEEQGETGQLRWTAIRLGLAIFFTMNLMAFTMTMWSLDVYDVQPDPFQTQLYEVFRWLSMTLTIPVLMLLGLPMLVAAATGRGSSFQADVLIVTGVVTAAGLSAVNVVRGAGPIYFEVSAMVLVMVTLGRWLEAEGRQKATAALDRLSALLPDTVTRVVASAAADQCEQSVSAADLSVGDDIRVRAGERFATDGCVVRGESLVDEQIFTGESTPVLRRPGDRVLAGTVSQDGDLIVRVEAPFRRGSFGRLLELMQQARTEQGACQRLADRVAAGFLPAVIVIAIATLIIHRSQGFDVALQNALSVLLIACPCALGLATPLAVWTTLSAAVQKQVLFRSGECIERLAGIRQLCSDKTGTLTTGRPRVVRCHTDPAVSPPMALHLSQTAAAASTHPFSDSVARFCSAEQSEAAAPDAAATGADPAAVPRPVTSRVVSGRGVEVLLDDGRTVRLGHPLFVSTHGFREATWLEESAVAEESIVAVAVDDRLVAVFELSETLRPGVAGLLRSLRELEIEVTVLTGDQPRRAAAFAESLQRLESTGLRPESVSVNGADASEPGSAAATPSAPATCDGPADSRLTVRGGLTPDEKVASLRTLRTDGRRIAMLGDGINDAPALAAADVGMALGCGTDIARDSAGVCLLNSDLTRVPWAIRQARRTTRVIRQNLGWAFGYNAAGIAAAASGWLNPAVAAGLMIGSSFLVITNSLRLLSPADDATSKTPGDAADTPRAANCAKMTHGETPGDPDSGQIGPHSGDCSRNADGVLIGAGSAQSAEGGSA